MGLGFNGGQLLALAIGRCYGNDLRDVAHDLGATIGDMEVTVTLELDGVPFVATNVVLLVKSTTLDGSNAQQLIDRALAVCTIANSYRQGVPATLDVVG
jgi:organic hydroperoxide reductase OsmC/OhrA